MAIPTYVGAGTVSGSTTTASPPWPTGHAAGDIGLLFVETANEAVTAPSGWTEVTNSPQGTGTAAGTAATRLTVYWKLATSGAEAAPTIADPGNHVIARILAFRGCDTTNPWNTTAGAVAASASTSVSVPGGTTTVNDCLIVAAVSNATDTSGSQTSGWANADLASVTNQVDTNNVSGNGGGIAVTTGGLATAGTFGATTATLTTSSVQGLMMIALQPPQGSGATVLPGVGALALTGFAPQIPQTVVAGLGQLTLTGFAPQVPRIVLPGLGQLTLTGFAPQVPRVIIPGLGQLTLTGFAPTVITSPQILPGTGQLVLTGLAPQVPKITIPGVGALTLTGFAPQVPRTVVAGLGQLTLTGFAPQVPRIVVPGVGQLTITGFAPTVITSPVILPGVGALVLTGFAPTVNVGAAQTPASGWRRVLYSEEDLRKPRRKRRREPEIIEVVPLPDQPDLPPSVVVELPAELPPTPAARRAEARRIAQAVAKQLEEDDEEVIMFLMHLLADL